MKSHHTLTDNEAHPVREQRAEAEALDRLPIDLPTVEDQEAEWLEQTTLVDMACGAAVVLLIIAALWVLLWWWSL